MPVLRASLSALLLLPCLASAAPRHAPGVGSAITPSFTIQPAAVMPDADVTILACVTNVSADSGRDVHSGDRFRFEFQDGVIGACGAVSTHPSSGPFAPADFTCEVAGSELALVYVGSRAGWPFGAGACASLEMHSPAVPSTVLVSRDVQVEGAYTTPAQAALLLAANDAIAVVGPPGPVGPEGPAGATGPQGPAGAPGTGAAASATTDQAVSVQAHAPPLPIPGLEVTLQTQAQSRLLVMHSVDDWNCGVSSPFGLPEVWIEIDGTLEVRVPIADESAHWLSDPLPEGPHVVKLVIRAPDTELLGASICVGAPSPSDRAEHGWRADLTVVEIRAVE